MFILSHPATEQSPAQTEYRYIGDAPNNYVKFNCDNDGTNCEIWRILGVFSVDDGTGNYEQRMKLVRGNSIKNDYWNTAQSNDWATSTLKTYLNGEYYNRIGNAADFGLKESAQNLIDNAKYYLGGGTSGSGFTTADTMYLWERGNEVYSFGNFCDENDFEPICNTENYCENNPTSEFCSMTRVISWVGVVSLMYPSDYYLVYANGVDAVCYASPSKCYFGDTSSSGTPTAGWIYNSNNYEDLNRDYLSWFISPSAVFPGHVSLVNSNGQFTYQLSNDSAGIRPVVYLSSSVQIIDGDGSEGSPYVLQN